MALAASDKQTMCQRLTSVARVVCDCVPCHATDTDPGFGMIANAPRSVTIQPQAGTGARTAEPVWTLVLQGGGPVTRNGNPDILQALRESVDDGPLAPGSTPVRIRPRCAPSDADAHSGLAMPRRDTMGHMSPFH